MGLAEVIQKARESEDRSPGERLFEYARTVRGKGENPPMAVGDLVRASSLPYLCPREEVLASRHEIIRARHIAPMLQLTMDIGHAFHDLYRDVYFGPMGEWAGAWECSACGWDTDKAGLSEPPKSHNGCISPGVVAKMPVKCGGCQAPFIIPASEGYCGHGTFKEWYLEDLGLGVRGHPDGWVVRLRSGRLLCDLKSHGHRGFGSRRSLRSGHDLQVWAYQYMCGDKATAVWYLNKSPWGDHPAFIRDISVEFDRKRFNSEIVIPVRKTLEGVAGGEVPDRTCISRSVPRAKDCQLAEICFSS